MASHWDINDQVNGTMPKLWGVFLMPLISLGLFLLFLLIPAIDPLKANIAKFRGAFNLFIAFMTLFLMYVQGLILAWNLGFTHLKMSESLLPAVGLLFILIGFMIRKAKRNFFIGIRTPWTLSSDKVWDETHRVRINPVHCFRRIGFDRGVLWRRNSFSADFNSTNGLNHFSCRLFVCSVSSGNESLIETG